MSGGAGSNSPPLLPKAVLLDMDDTILYDSGNVAQCWQEACFAHRSEMGALEPGALYDVVERTREWFWSDPERHRKGRLDLDAARREIVRISLAGIGMDSPALAEKIADRYGSQRELGVQPFGDAIETVRWLRDSGCHLALLTNGSADSQRSKVERFKLAEMFDLILIEGELGYGKPDPRVYRLALDRFGVAPTEVWMVGDNLDWDVGAPQQLGIFGIWVDVRGEGLPPGHAVRPNRIIRGLWELRARPTLPSTPG